MELIDRFLAVLRDDGGTLTISHDPNREWVVSGWSPAAGRVYGLGQTLGDALDQATKDLRPE